MPLAQGSKAEGCRALVLPCGPSCRGRPHPGTASPGLGVAAVGTFRSPGCYEGSQVCKEPTLPPVCLRLVFSCLRSDPASRTEGRKETGEPGSPPKGECLDVGGKGNHRSGSSRPTSLPQASLCPQTWSPTCPIHPRALAGVCPPHPPARPGDPVGSHMLFLPPVTHWRGPWEE